MESLVELLDQNTIFAFLLLLARILAFVAFMPVFGHKSVSSTVRVAIAFYFALFLFPLVEVNELNIASDSAFLLALISEITFGAVAAMLVQIIFSAIQIVGDLIGFATALSMANMFDPATGTQQGIVSRFLYLIILVLYFQTGMYEVTLLMLAKSIGMIHLGAFNLYDYNILQIAATEVKNMFIFAFAFAFPLFFIGFVLDVYYGYGTKSMPAFSPFVVTFQIKFALIFLFLMLGLDIFASSFEQYFIGKFS
jgi:flagellar biosynthetic protein FliR